MSCHETIGEVDEENGIEPAFDTVKILADDLRLRENRLALLQKVFSLFQELLDFSQIQDV